MAKTITITLQGAFDLLDGCAAAFDMDGALFTPCVYDLRGQSGNIFAEYHYTNADEGFDVSCSFREGDNQFAELDGNTLTLTSLSGDKVSSNLLEPMDVVMFFHQRIFN